MGVWTWEHRCRGQASKAHTRMGLKFSPRHLMALPEPQFPYL